MSKDNNIISFPNQSERILDKAENLIEKEKFQEAYDLLETIEVSEENIIEVEFMRILCLTEFGRVEEAISKCQLMLDSVYVEEVLFIYVNLLRSLGRDDEAVIEMMKYEAMHNEDDDELDSLFQLIDGIEDEIEIDEEEFREVMMDSDRLEEQDTMLRILEKQDIIPYFKVIKELLKDEGISNVLKSMLLSSLHIHKVKRKVTVTKFGREITMLGDKSPMKSNKWSFKVEDEISKLIEHQNPMLHNQVLELWDSFMFLAYPFIFDEISAEIWANAIIRYFATISGEEITDVEMKEFYFSNQEQIHEAIQLIEKTIDVSGKVL